MVTSHTLLRTVDTRGGHVHPSRVHREGKGLTPGVGSQLAVVPIRKLDDVMTWAKCKGAVLQNE